MINKKIICAIELPFTHIAICEKNKDNRLSNYLVKIKELENYFEKVFLSKGGKIIHSKLAKKKIKSTFKKNDSFISITIKNGPLYNTSNEKIIYNNITINNITHLLCCDGGRPSSRQQLSVLLSDDKILDYFLYDENKNEYEAELKNKLIQENENNKHIVSYGVACNVLIEKKIVEDIKVSNGYEEKQKDIRFFIPYDNPNYTIKMNRKTYIKAYLGIQIRTKNISTLLTGEIVDTFYTNLYKITDKSKIKSVLENINRISRVAIIINKVFRKNKITNYTFLKNILPTCYHISIFPIQLYSAKEYLIEKTDFKTKIAFIGDASFGVHYFSGTGVNIGMNFGKHIIDYFKDNIRDIKNIYSTFVNAIKNGSTEFILN